MIVDFHTHVLPSHIKQDRSSYIGRDAAFAAIYSQEKAAIATADDLIASMDREDIDFSVIVNYGWSTPQLCIETNDYIMESVARYPQRLAGFGSVSSLTGEDILSEVDRCAAGGLKGIGELRPDTCLPDFTEADVVRSFVESLQRHRFIFLTHASEPVGHIYPGKGGATPELLYPFIGEFPDLKIVCAHWGGGLPFYALMPEVKEALRNVYFDTAASPFLYRPQVYRQVIELVGAGRILFGSDYPLMPPSRLLRELDPLELTVEERESILFGNACRLLGIE